jgi:hypothetical protein
MKKVIEKFGRLITASIIIMGVGYLIFLVPPLMLSLFNMDTDILGAFIMLIGLMIYIIGVTRKKELNRLKLIILGELSAILSIPVAALIFLLFYYLITGKLPD